MDQVIVTKFDANGTQVLVCCPENSRRSLSPLLLNFTAPTYVLYGDKTQYTAEDAASLVRELGLAGTASQYGGLVLVVQGQNESWQPSDLSAYDHVLACMNPDTSAKYENGIGIGRNFFTHAEEKRIVGFPGGVHLVGCGSGADFIAANMIRALPLERKRKPGAMVSPDHSPASVLLVGASVVPTVDGSVIPGSPDYQVPLRVAAINCPVGTGNALSVLGADNWACLEKNNIADGNALLLKGFCNRFLRQAEQLLPLPVWEEEGMVCRTESRTVPTAPGNPSVKTLTHTISYNLYYPDDVDIQRDQIPLMLTFHGGGNTALFMATASQWPQIAKENRIMIAAVDQHTSCPAEEVMALVTGLMQDYPCIDPGKLYANGYSMGAVKCWELIEKYPAVFAGVAPMHGSFAAGLDKIPPYPTPVFYVGGELSPLPEFPYQGDNLRQRVEYVLKVNRVPVDYKPDYQVNRWWGINGNRREEIPDSVTYQNSVLTVEYFNSEDGSCCTALSGGSNEGHEVYDRNCRAAWSFLCHWRRNPDGTLTNE